MWYLGKTKIGRFASKPNVIYPQMRLPRDCHGVIGETACVYEVAHLGKRAFLFVLEGEEMTDVIVTGSQVLQPDPKVVKLSAEVSVEDRLSELESQITELKSLIFAKETGSPHLIEKEGESNGLGRIRTGDLRHVKATS
jgi:hypothetical protein